MSVDAGSPLAREWAREEIEKLNRLDMAELEADERETQYRVILIYADDTIGDLTISESELLPSIENIENKGTRIVFVEERS